MGKYFNNAVPVNNGLLINGQTPVDDRFVFESIADLFISASMPKASQLYTNAYRGLVVVCFGDANGLKTDRGYMLTLENAAPYTKGSEANVNKNNYLEFWRQADVDIQDALNEAKDYTDDLSTNVDAINVATQNRITELNNYVDTLNVAANQRIADVSAYSIRGIAEAKQMAIDSSYWNRGEVLPTDIIYEDYGDLKNETAADLEGLTVSEILNRILFEFCVPHKVGDMSGTVSLSSSFTGGVEVGAAFPAVSAFRYAFTSEKWQWKSRNYDTNGVAGPVKELSQFSNVTYYYKPESGDAIEVGTSAYAALTVNEGTNKGFYGVIEYAAKDNATDSRNNDRDKDGNYYAKAKDGSLTTSQISFPGGWKTYTDAPKVYTSASSAWAGRNTNPGNILANDCYNKIHSGAIGKASETAGVMMNDTHTVWFQWPAGTTDVQKFLVWVPESYHITAAKFANDTATNTFDINAYFAYQTTRTFQNRPGGNGQFDEYLIEKAAGISTVQITIEKGARS